MSKVMETDINTQLLKYLNNKNITHDRQNGFHKHRSTVNKVQFNVQKSQATTLTKKSHVCLPTVEMEGRPIVESSSVKLLSLSLKRHPISLGFCSSVERCIHQSSYCPTRQRSDHRWNIAPIQNRAVRLIDAANLTKDLHSLEHRRRVAGLPCFTDSMTEDVRVSSADNNTEGRPNRKHKRASARIYENGRETVLSYENDILKSKTVNGVPHSVTYS
nr:unnamed protein product [Callosobruchus analis]